MTIELSGPALARLRENRNMKQEVLAKRSGLNLEYIRTLETETTEIPLREAEVISKALKVSWLALLDDDLEPIKNYSQDNRSAKHKNEKLDVEIQKVIEDVEHLLDLSYELNPEDTFDLQDPFLYQKSPEYIAAELRKSLKVDVRTLDASNGEYDIWNYWKTLFSNRGLYIFERSWDIKSVRAFSLTRKNKYAAVVSTKDIPLARAFSLLHEVFHIIRNEQSICDLHYSSNDSDIEVECNRFAASFLMPEKDFNSIAQKLGLKPNTANKVTDHVIKSLQKNFHTSRLSTYRRLYTLRYIGQSEYEKIQDSYDGFEKFEKKSTGGSKEIYYRTRLNGVGKKLAGELFNAYSSNQLTSLSLANVLKIRVSQLPAVNNLMGGNGTGD